MRTMWGELAYDATVFHSFFGVARMIHFWLLFRFNFLVVLCAEKHNREYVYILGFSRCKLLRPSLVSFY